MTLWALISDVHGRGDRLARVLADLRTQGAARASSRWATSRGRRPCHCWTAPARCAFSATGRRLGCGACRRPIAVGWPGGPPRSAARRLLGRARYPGLAAEPGHRRRGGAPPRPQSPLDPALSLAPALGGEPGRGVCRACRKRLQPLLSRTYARAGGVAAGGGQAPERVDYASSEGGVLQLSEGERWLIGVGSVGEPHDGPGAHTPCMTAAGARRCTLAPSARFGGNAVGRERMIAGFVQFRPVRCDVHTTWPRSSGCCTGSRPTCSCSPSLPTPGICTLPRLRLPRIASLPMARVHSLARCGAWRRRRAA